MKRKSKLKKVSGETSLDLDLLKHWKKVSTKGKLDWLSSALYFGKFKKFN